MNSDLILVNLKVRNRPNEINSLKLWKARTWQAKVKTSKEKQSFQNMQCSHLKILQHVCRPTRAVQLSWINYNDNDITTPGIQITLEILSVIPQNGSFIDYLLIKAFVNYFF